MKEELEKMLAAAPSGESLYSGMSLLEDDDEDIDGDEDYDDDEDFDEDYDEGYDEEEEER